MASNKAVRNDERLRTEEFILGRQRQYQAVFDKESPMSEAVLKDLAKFCRANESTFDPDQRVHAVLEGRREVWLRIKQHLDLSSQDLFELLTGTKF